MTGATLCMTCLFVAGTVLSTDGVERKAKRSGTRPSALHSIFHILMNSRRIASFMMLSMSKIEEVSWNSFVFDLVKFQKLGSRFFPTCQVMVVRFYVS